MIVYGFNYNSCIHESSPATMSLHLSREGAEEALKEHQLKALDKFNRLWEGEEEELNMTFGEFESWDIEIFEVLP